MPPAGASAGPPARRAAVSVGDAAGSTPTTRVPGRAPAYQVATPAISPPPPTATSTSSRSGACSPSSRPSVPAPMTVSRWSNAWTASAWPSRAQSRLARSASS